MFPGELRRISKQPIHILMETVTGMNVFLLSFSHLHKPLVCRMIGQHELYELVI